MNIIHKIPTLFYYYTIYIYHSENSVEISLIFSEINLTNFSIISSSMSDLRRRGAPYINAETTSETTYSISPVPSYSSFDSTITEITMASNSGRDRTMEFANTVRSLSSRQLNHDFHGKTPLSKHAYHEQLTKQNKEFMTIAKSIGQDIAKTYTKLEKLTLLAKRRTLFDDRPQEIQELISIIKQDTSALNRQIDQLSRISKSQQQTLRSKHQATHSTTVVAALQLRLASMTSAFKEVLEVRSENLRESKNRREQFSQGAVTRSLPESAMNGFPSGSVLMAMEDDEAASRNNGQVFTYV